MDQKNFIVAIVLSVLIIMGWQYAFPPKHTQQQPQQQHQQQTTSQSTSSETSASSASPSAPPSSPGSAHAAAEPFVPREQALAKSPRVTFDTAELIGSINLDIRSFALNAEAGLVCFDPAVVARLHEVESDYLRDSQQLELHQWRRRPRWHRSVEGMARLADSLM